MSFNTKRVQAFFTQNPQIPDCLPLLVRLAMNQVLSEYSPQEGQEYLIQFWQCISPQGSTANGFDVTTEGQPFHIPQPNEYLYRYGESCVDKGCSFVGQNTEVENWLVGRAIQKRLADQGTIQADGSHDQKFGLFVMPVFFVRGTRKQTVGIIELVTIVPKPSYGEEFTLINGLLKEQDIGENESLESGEMGKMIKVEIPSNGENQSLESGEMGKPKVTKIKFPLSFSAKRKNLETNVADRIETGKFSIGYKDENEIYHPISSDRDLEVCIQASISKEAPFIAMVVNLTA